MELNYNEMIAWFESTAIYKDVVSKLPSPLNNPVFSGIIALVIIFFAVCTIVENIKNYRIRRRIKRKNQEYEEKKLDDKIKAAEEKEQNKDMEKYMQFMMMAQMQNMTSMQNMTFEQWKKQSIEGTLAQTQLQEQPKEEPVVETDPMTGLANETALKKALENYNVSELSIISVCVNRSRRGKMSEQELFDTITSNLCDVWGENKCFRTTNGGFLILSTKEFRKSIEKEIHTFKEYLGDLAPLVAVGLADASDVEGMATIEKIRKASEQAMHADKTKKKEDQNVASVEVTGLTHIFNNYKKEGGAHE